ncbi:unnamed protein product [Prunus armeniaca]
MEEYRRCLERQERERKERNRRADEINELQRQVDEQVLIAVAMEEEENQGRRHGSQVGRRRNVDRHRHSRGKNLLEDYFIPTVLYSDKATPEFFRKIRHEFFSTYGKISSHCLSRDNDKLGAKPHTKKHLPWCSTPLRFQ